MIGGIVAPVIRRFSFSSEILEHELVEFIKNVIFCNITWHRRFADLQFYRFTDLQVCVDPHFVLGDLPLRRQGVGGLLVPLFLQPASHVGVV